MHPVVAEKEFFKIDLEIINLHVSYKLQKKLKYKNKKQNQKTKRWMKTDHAGIFSGLSINSVRLLKKTLVYFISRITKTQGEKAS